MVNTMSLTPISRDTLRLLKSQKEEEERKKAELLRLQTIDGIVKGIYDNVIKLAETTTTPTQYQYSIPQNNILQNITMVSYDDHRLRDKRGHIIPQHRLPPYDFHIENMPDILATLQSLFPDCSIKYTHLVRAPDGKMYNIESLDKSVMPFIQSQKSEAYIVVDWT
jgi:hypothetical protein